MPTQNFHVDELLLRTKSMTSTCHCNQNNVPALVRVSKAFTRCRQAVKMCSPWRFVTYWNFVWGFKDTDFIVALLNLKYHLIRCFLHIPWPTAAPPAPSVNYYNQSEGLSSPRLDSILPVSILWFICWSLVSPSSLMYPGGGVSVETHTSTHRHTHFDILIFHLIP